MLEVVAGIGDHQQVAGRQHAAQAERELGAADAAGKRNHARHSRSLTGTGPRAAGGPDVAAGDAGPRPGRGRAPAPPAAPRPTLPMSSEAAAAISSANPVSVTRSARPKRSGRPRMSSSAGRPAAPSATPTVPRRQARPQLSLTITPASLPKVRGRVGRAARRPRRPGSSRQQQHRLRAGRRIDVGAVDAGIGHDEAEPMLDDQHARPLAHHAARFAQDDLDQARVLVDLAASLRARADGSHASRDRRSGPRPWTRSSARRPGRRRRRARASARSQRGDQRRGEIVARPQPRDVGNVCNVTGMVAAVRRSGRPCRPLGEMRQHVLGER